MTNPSALYLPGVNGEFVECTTGGLIGSADVSGVVHVALNDWTPTAQNTLLGRDYNVWELSVQSSGILRILSNGANVFDSTVAPTVSDSQDLWVGFTIDGSVTDVKFFTSADGSSWSQLGSTVTAGPHSPSSSTNTIRLGARSSVNTPSAGIFYYAAVYDGIGANTAPGQGTLVAEFRADAPIEPRYRDSTGKIWTLNGSAYSFVEVA